jgi:hypothetical protein
MSICTVVTTPALSKQVVTCMREVDENGRHRGQHQGIEHVPYQVHTLLGQEKVCEAYDRLVTWSASGSSSQKYDPDQPNTNCTCGRGTYNRTGHQPEDHRWANCAGCGIIFDSKGEPSCFNCGYWQERVDNYGKVMAKGQRFVRAHDDDLSHEPWLYVWSPGHGGAFGGRKFTVTFDDGTVVGPADFLWSNGRIPWWLVDRFPPNARIEDQREHELRPGHTTGFRGAGQPLRYTAHPSL